jgi:hypothetical protein
MRRIADHRSEKVSGRDNPCRFFVDALWPHTGRMGRINKRLHFVTPYFIRTAAAIMVDIETADGIDTFRVFCQKW